MTEKILDRKNRSYSKNPFIESLFTADPSAHVWGDGRLYVYPSHDVDPARGCDLMDQYHVYSTDDMANWRDEGQILSSGDVEWGRPSGGFMWAPDCAFKNGKYYFYFPHPSDEKWNDSWKIGVAVSDSPVKDFKSIGFIEGVGGHAMIDPATFVDNDGKGYMYYGGGGHCVVAELNEDMVSVSGEVHEMDGLVDFHEAAWVFKRNGLYYMTYSDNHHGNNNLCYAISDNPMGPWDYKGVYLLPTDCETSHGSVVEYKGEWYAFYHSDDLSNQGVLRSICWDPIVFNDDGTMQVVTQTRNGHPKLSDSPKKDYSNVKIYGSRQVSEIEGTQLVEQKDAYEGACLRSCREENNSKIVFENVDGFESGFINLGIYFATESKLAKCSIFVNDEFVSLLNLVFTGSWRTFDGYSNITMQVEPGQLNKIEIRALDGDFSFEAISTEEYFN
ncbi:family 43 glycosylhydrolase [Dellaglioa algida]|uniref:family 43 glycosylhydrolase n=1 Tax=Dellaglioa algida TaxID=105612 RepID=UPI0024C4CC3D|nr:family 43 glycosylhydrolase [Dellaglioa algida]MDK1726115.1 family 43 glycosylhydrolase [Dellaglioa algida]